MNYLEKCVQFIDSVNKDYEKDGLGSLYFKERNVAVCIREKYDSCNKNKPQKYFSDLHNKYNEKGIRLIQLFDWQIDNDDSWTKIQSLLTIAIGSPRRVYARNCEIREVTNDEARVLNDQIHMQGHRNAKVTYGLFYKDELVQIMSFSKAKWNRNIKGENEWEIIRGCPGSNNIVIGGCAKCFSHFIRDYDPDCIFSYCDTGLFNGASYRAIGMKYAGNTGETKWWILDEYDEKTNTHGIVIPRNPARYKEYKTRSNNTIIWTAGSDRYVWCKEGYTYTGKGKELLATT